MPQLSDVVESLFQHLVKAGEGQPDDYVDLLLLGKDLGYTKEQIKQAIQVLQSEGAVEAKYFGTRYIGRVSAVRRVALEKQKAGKAESPVQRKAEAQERDPSKVFIIQGRNKAASDELRKFLLALGLEEWTFDDVARDLGNEASIYDIVARGMSGTKVVIAFFTPDELARLQPREQFRREHDERRDVVRWQPRPNVLYEAGLARGLAPKDALLLVSFGRVDLPSDLDGIHILRLRNDLRIRKDLRERLITAGCAVKAGDEWMQSETGGNFDPTLVEVPDIRELLPADEGTFVSTHEVIEQAFRDVAYDLPGMTKDQIEKLMKPGPERDAWFESRIVTEDGALRLPVPSDNSGTLSYEIPRPFLEKAREKIERRRKYDARHPLEE